MIEREMDRWVARAARLSGESLMTFEERQAIVDEAFAAVEEVLCAAITYRRELRRLGAVSLTGQLEAEQRQRVRVRYETGVREDARQWDANRAAEEPGFPIAR